MVHLSAGTFGIRRRAAQSRFLTASGGSIPLYARSFFASISLQALAVMGLIEAIFLAERFPMVFRDVLKNNADLIDTSLIFALNSTQIFDLALAIAILMAVYWTTLRMREDRELLVLFTAGIGPYRLTALTLVIACTAQVGSIAVSGVIDPMSRYAQRVILFDAQFRALTGGIDTGQFYYFKNRVAFAPGQTIEGGHRASPAQSRNLFVYDEVEPGTFRVVTATRASVEGPDSFGNIFLKLGGFTSHVFSDPQPSADATTPPAKSDTTACSDCPERQGALYASDVSKQMTIDELLPFPARGSEAAELTIFDQLGTGSEPPSPKRLEEMRLLGERFARSLLCLLAPLIGLAAVCLTSRATNYFALPLACMALMSLNVASEWLIRTIAPSRVIGACAAPIGFTVMLMALLLLVVIRKQGELIRPKLGRA